MTHVGAVCVEPGDAKLPGTQVFAVAADFECGLCVGDYRRVAFPGFGGVAKIPDVAMVAVAAQRARRLINLISRIESVLPSPSDCRATNRVSLADSPRLIGVASTPGSAELPGGSSVIE